VLCHNDFINETFWSPPPVTPVVTGVIDFEPASFDDPMLTSPKRFSMPHSISHRLLNLGHRATVRLRPTAVRNGGWTVVDGTHRQNLRIDIFPP
jgi:hypothetical protein